MFTRTLLVETLATLDLAMIAMFVLLAALALDRRYHSQSTVLARLLFWSVIGGLAVCVHEAALRNSIADGGNRQIVRAVTATLLASIAGIRYFGARLSRWQRRMLLFFAAMGVFYLFIWGLHVVSTGWAALSEQPPFLLKHDHHVTTIVSLLGMTAMAAVGAAGCWIALGRHLRWYVRAVLVFVPLALPLVQLRAHDLLAIVAVQLSVAALALKFAAGGSLARGVSPAGDARTDRQPRWQFSLLSFLALSSMAAVGMAIVASQLRRNPDGLVYVSMVGALAGLAVLLVHLVVNRVESCAVRVGLLLSIGWCLAIAPSHFSNGPRVLGALGSLQDPIWPDGGYFSVRWYVVYLGAVLLLAVWVAQAKAAGLLQTAASAHHGRHRFARSRLVVMTLALLLPCALLYPALSHNPPAPQVELPEPNGFEMLLPLLEQFGRVGPTRAPTTTEEEIEDWWVAYAEANMASLDEVRQVVSYPACVNLQSRDDPYLRSYGIIAARELTMTIQGAARAAERAGRWHEAVQWYFDLVRFADTLAGRGGLRWDAILGTAFEGMGRDGLYGTIPHLDADECRTLIRQLHAVDEAQEPVDALMRRERNFHVQLYGWQARLFFLLDDRSRGGSGEWFDFRRRNDAMRRLLMTELALHAYQSECGAWPVSLDALVPDYLPEVLLDPFTDAPLIYRLSEDGADFLLYSIGENRLDDGGVCYKYQIDRDLNLRGYYGTEVQVPVGEAETNEEATAPQE